MSIKTKDNTQDKGLSEAGQNLLTDLDNLMNISFQNEEMPPLNFNQTHTPLDQAEEDRLAQAFDDYMSNITKQEDCEIVDEINELDVMKEMNT